MFRILIADDEIIERMVLERKLRQYFGDTCEISAAQNGRQVLEMYGEFHPHLLILDIEMPGITGLDAAQKIREKDQECSIVFLTAFDEFSYAKRAISVRALDYLLKPCDDNELVSAVEESMRIWMERGNVSLPGAADHESAPGSGREAPADTNRSPEQDLRTGEESDGAEGARAQQEIIRKYIRDQFMNNIGIQDIARHLGYSEVYFCKIFKQSFGQSFVSYLTGYRIGKAKEMLEDSTLSIKDIGRSCGYEDSNYFAKVFRRVTGQSPSDYRTGARRQ